MRAPKNRIQHRIKIIQGQLKGLEKMVEEDKYCVDVLTLSLSIQRALRELDNLILEDHIKTCVVDDVKGGKVDKVSEELVRLFSVAKK